MSRGAARIIDFWGDLTQYNTSPSSVDADSLALWCDFHSVAADLSRAMGEATPPPDQLPLFENP